MKDGIYFDIVTIKDGAEYLVRRISVNDVSKILTNQIMDGLSTILGISENDIIEYKENKQHEVK